jgi:hypothetical protein
MGIGCEQFKITIPTFHTSLPNQYLAWTELLPVSTLPEAMI